MAVCSSPLRVLLVALLAASALFTPVAAGRQLSQCELRCFLCTFLTLVAVQQAASHVQFCSTMQSVSLMMQKAVWRQMYGRSSISFSLRSTLSLTCAICPFCRCGNRGPSVAEQVHNASSAVPLCSSLLCSAQCCTLAAADVWRRPVAGTHSRTSPMPRPLASGRLLAALQRTTMTVRINSPSPHSP